MEPIRDLLLHHRIGFGHRIVHSLDDYRRLGFRLDFFLGLVLGEPGCEKGRRILPDLRDTPFRASPQRGERGFDVLSTAELVPDRESQSLDPLLHIVPMRVTLAAGELADNPSLELWDSSLLVGIKGRGLLGLRYASEQNRLLRIH
jgi:hypothetical protein